MRLSLLGLWCGKGFYGEIVDSDMTVEECLRKGHAVLRLYIYVYIYIFFTYCLFVYAVPVIT